MEDAEMRDELKDAYDEPWYGVGHVQFESTALDGWIDDDEPPHERATFLADITSRWRHFDWGTVDDDQVDRNNHLVSHDIPGLVIGRYPVPSSLEPEFPELLVITKFAKHGRYLAFYAAIEWANPEQDTSRGLVPDPGKSEH